MNAAEVLIAEGDYVTATGTIKVKTGDVQWKLFRTAMYKNFGMENGKAYRVLY